MIQNIFEKLNRRVANDYIFIIGNDICVIPNILKIPLTGHVWISQTQACM